MQIVGGRGATFMKALAGGVVLASAYPLVQRLARPHLYAETFIGKVTEYELDIARCDRPRCSRTRSYTSRGQRQTDLAQAESG